MSEKNNAKCAICGSPYHVCKSCKNIKSFTPWRTVTDTIEHYKIYLAVHDYTLTKNKNAAKQALSICNLSGLDGFNESVKNVIKQILEDEANTTSDEKQDKSTVKRKNNKVAGHTEEAATDQNASPAKEV